MSSEPLSVPLSTGSPAGRPMHVVMPLRRPCVGWLNVQSGPCKPQGPTRGGNGHLERGEHGPRPKAIHEKCKAPKPGGGGEDDLGL